MPAKTIIQNSALVVGSLAIIFLLGELGVRTFDWKHGYGFFSNHRNILLRPLREPIRPFRTFGNDLYTEKDAKKYIVSTHKELYPLEKEPNTYRIVALGGSTTQNFIEGSHYPKILQEKLQNTYPGKKIEVINVGHDSYATPHMIILLALDVVSWQADLLIISENVNDLTAGYFKNFTLDYANKYSNQAFIPYNKYLSYFTAPNALFQWSSFYWFVSNKIEVLQDKMDRRQQEKNPARFPVRSYGMALTPEVESVYTRNLRTLIAIAKIHNIQTILGTQPLAEFKEYQEQPFRYNTKYGDAVLYPKAEEFIAHHHRFNDLIRITAKETLTLLADNAIFLHGKKEYFTDIVHYTQPGLEKLSENYYTIIVRNNLIQ